MRIKGTDRKSLHKLAAGVPSPDGYADLYPTARRRIVDILASVSAGLANAGIAISVETEPQPGEAAARLIARFDLTATEARLALFLAEGGTLAAYAARHKVSRNTARTHLSGVFQKTGVNRQADLVRLVVHHASAP